MKIPEQQYQFRHDFGNGEPDEWSAWIDIDFTSFNPNSQCEFRFRKKPVDRGSGYYLLKPRYKSSGTVVWFNNDPGTGHQRMKVEALPSVPSVQEYAYSDDDGKTWSRWIDGTDIRATSGFSELCLYKFRDKVPKRGSGYYRLKPYKLGTVEWHVSDPGTGYQLMKVKVLD